MARWVRTVIAAMVLALLGGVSACGPLMMPMVPRVSEDQQREIDAGWNNLMSPTGRADRQLLLDVLLTSQWYEEGVDHLRFRSQKKLAAGGTVVMEVFYDRAHPESDRFVVEVYDPSWNMVRRESYSRADVETTGAAIYNPPHCANADAPTPEEWAHVQAYQKRLQAIVAATQPATQPAVR